MPTAYLAARYSRRLELCGYRDQLAIIGIDVPARWLNGNHQLNNAGQPINEDGSLQFPDETDPDPARWRQRFAEDDYFDVLAADILIAFTEQPRATNSRGGRHVELGIALGIALGIGTPVFIVGPRENVFCHLPQVRQYDTWTQLFTLLGDVFAGSASVTSLIPDPPTARAFRARLLGADR